MNEKNVIIKINGSLIYSSCVFTHTLTKRVSEIVRTKSSSLRGENGKLLWLLEEKNSLER
jgi:hypothetical protein